MITIGKVYMWMNNELECKQGSKSGHNLQSHKVKLLNVTLLGFGS